MKTRFRKPFRFRKVMKKGVIHRARFPYFLTYPLFGLAADGRLPWVWNIFFSERYPFGGERRWFRLGIFIADHLPWFARKRLVNRIAKREVLSDFMNAEKLEPPFSFLCMRW